MLNSQSLSRQNFFITLGLALAMALIALNQAGAAEDVRKLRLAYSGWEIGTAVAYIGVDAGLFKKHGLEIEELPIRDTLTAGVQSLIGVDLLIGFGNPLAVLQPVANGSDITVIGSHVSFDQYGMGVGSTIGSLKDLKGKKVGVSALGARSDLVARVILRRAGLDPSKDVEMVAAGLAPARALALSKNLVQGVPLNQEVAGEAQKLGIKILEMKSVPVVTDLLLTTRSFIKREEITIRRFMQGYAAAIQFFVSKRDASLSILKKYFPGNQAVSVDTMYDAFSAQLRPLPELNSEALQALVDVGAAVDQRTKNLKPADIIEPRFFDELKNSQFLKDLYIEKVSL
ncbi:MAG: ABC transporter substrate-binding protein [Deltaproteobacteria bacterium]|jgi:ABC-type nitrate/sulfonate/bicarbonate transport system substrate-binding protein|nr:MAG: ABC transporter substrate-binding protein [Deltaproteobacteria bacterium]